MTRRLRLKAPGFAAFAALCAIWGATGCDQIDARRKIQKGSKLYNEGKFSEAADEFEKALEIAPDITIGQYNAALANFRAFEPGNDSKANMGYAERAGAHFETYLKESPDDRRMVELMTTLWLDSGQFAKAEEYWQAELSKNEKDPDVLRQMAKINLAAGKHDETIRWIERRCDLEEKNDAKVDCFLDIAKIQWSRLRKVDLVDLDRLQVADVGLAALQKAEKLDPNNAGVQSYLGSLYELRKLAHGAGWAQAVDAASERMHKLKFIELQKQAAAAAPPAKSDTATEGGK
jgi:tetratricopeptide (TPR) repeat protein